MFVIQANEEVHVFIDGGAVKFEKSEQTGGGLEVSFLVSVNNLGIPETSVFLAFFVLAEKVTFFCLSCIKETDFPFCFIQQNTRPEDESPRG